MARGADRNALPRRAPWAAVAVVTAASLLTAAVLGLLFGAGGAGDRTLGLLALVAGAAVITSALAVRVLARRLRAAERLAQHSREA